MARHCYVLRVFTRDDVGGNHLGVVTDILGLDDEKMQRLATELGFSETIYLSWFEGDIPKARIFTPGAEIPFAGHPLVGAAWVLLNLSPLDPDWIECQIGPVGIRQENFTTWIDAPAGQPVEPVAVSLDGWVEPREAVVVRMPLPYLLLQLDSPDAVHRAVPQPTGEWSEVYLWAWEEEGKSVRSRFFAPSVGVPEDPATGSAAVALAARMRWAGVESGGVTVHQGEETGFPSRIHLHWNSGITSIGGAVAKDEVRFVAI
ncbi:MAG TPA: PhzF family phenazine biosynthesis protein [Acidimicrobiia bacterium]|nr:PhzF family phenazine biosynthesis protein [Acidimicrobiia bacterium]